MKSKLLLFCLAAHSTISYSNTFIDNPSFDLGGEGWDFTQGEVIKTYTISQGSLSTFENYLAMYPNRNNEYWGNHGVHWINNLRLSEGLGLYFKAEMSFSRKCKKYLVNFKVRDQLIPFGEGEIRYDKSVILSDSKAFTQFISDSKFYPGSLPVRIEITFAPKDCESPDHYQREFQIDYFQLGSEIIELGGLGNGPKPDTAQ